MRRYAIGLALMLLVVGFETTALGEDTLRQLISGEIRSLVRNGTLIRAVPCDPAASYHQEETIRSDGSFTVYADLADVTGKVSIERDMLCLTVGEKLVCRKILTDGHGLY